MDEIERLDENECIIMKEVHFYISDDRVHDRSYVAQFFVIFFEDFGNCGINVSKH